MDDRAVEKAAALEILDEAGNRSVDFFAGRWQGVGDIAVMIPVLVLGKHLDEPHSRSTSLRAMRQRVPKSLVAGSSMPYIFLVASLSPEISITSVAAVCMRAASSKLAMRASRSSSPGLGLPLLSWLRNSKKFSCGFPCNSAGGLRLRTRGSRARTTCLDKGWAENRVTS